MKRVYWVEVVWLNQKDVERIERNLDYCREQIERFLLKYYRVKFNGKLYGDKSLSTKYKYSDSSFDSNGFAKIFISTDILEGSGDKNKGLQLMAIQREAIKYAFHLQRMDYGEDSIEFKAELHRHGLPMYNGLPETGLDLHTYVCQECKKIWAVKLKKLPVRLDPTVTKLNKKTGKYVLQRTSCCKAPFEYLGVKHYSNAELNKLKYMLDGKENEN